MRAVLNGIGFVIGLSLAATSAQSKVISWATPKSVPLRSKYITNANGDVLPEQISIGVGYDSITGELKSKCVVEDDSALKTPVEIFAQDDALHEDQISNESELSNFLSVSASASFAVGLYSGDASVSYSRSSKLTNYGNYIGIQETIRNGRQDLSRYHLNKTGKYALKRGVRAFIQVCGDRYVSGKVTGGSLSAVISVLASNKTEQSQFLADLHAAIGYVKASGSVQSTQSSFEANHQWHADILRKGPSDAWPTDTVEHIMSYAREFPTKVRFGSKQAWTVDYVATTYDEVREAPTDSPRRAAFFDTELPYIQRLHQALNDFSYARAAGKDEFPPTSTVKLDAVLQSLKDEINKTDNAARDCAFDVNACQALTHIPVPPSPERPTDWENVAVNIRNFTQYATVIAPDQVFMEIKGFAYTQCANPGAGTIPATQFFVKLLSTKGQPGGQPFLYSGTAIRIPGDNTVSLRVNDDSVPIGPEDNCSDKSDPVRVRFFKPIFDNDFSISLVGRSIAGQLSVSGANTEERTFTKDELAVLKEVLNRDKFIARLTASQQGLSALNKVAKLVITGPVKLVLIWDQGLFDGWAAANGALRKISDARTCDDLAIPTIDNSPNADFFERMRTLRGCDR